MAPRIVGKKWEETGEDELSVSLAGPLSRFNGAERETLMTTTSQKVMFDLINDAGILPAAADRDNN